MPRVKQSKPKHIPSAQTSSDAVPVVTDPDAFAPGLPVVDASTDATLESGDKKPKKTRVPKVKPCQRCEERRARERQYAKASRLRLRTGGAPPTTPADGAPAAPTSETASAPPPEC